MFQPATGVGQRDCQAIDLRFYNVRIAVTDIAPEPRFPRLELLSTEDVAERKKRDWMDDL
jgi:hypothetical protein